MSAGWWAFAGFLTAVAVLLGVFAWMGDVGGRRGGE